MPPLVKILASSGCVVWLGLLAGGTAAKAQQSLLTSPAIDTQMFRPGEVARSERDYGRWRIVCDEVLRLRQKFCSLSSSAYDSQGLAQAAILVSTADDGSPAAIITLPLGMALRKPVMLGAGKAKSSQASAGRLVTPAFCAEDGCKIIWRLSAQDIAGLRNGADLRLSFVAAAHQPGDDPFARHRQAALLNLTIHAAGFNDAVADSVR